ncbi:MAG TPA: response regulator transcription factor [Vicinamibacteria bacterium]|nr:response regulator transcription factor [Vicinamibacteria bacterium]
MKVLLIDDSTVVRSRLVRLLEDLGDIDVEEADDAPVALDSLRRARPDAVILDIRLRTSSGLEVLREIKRADSPPLVIMLTNHASEHHRRYCQKNGADYFFDKTREFEKVLDVLAQRR